MRINRAVQIAPVPNLLCAMLNHTTTDGTTQVTNPTYQAWLQHDQMALSVILSSLIEDVLAQVLFLGTVHEVWTTLENMFSTQSRAWVMQIRIEMANFRKREMPMHEYFNCMKLLADTLASVGHPMQEEEIATYILTGLNSNYDPHITSVTARADAITLGDLYAHLISYDLCKEHNEAITYFPGSFANYVSHDQFSSHGRGKGGRGRGNSG